MVEFKIPLVTDRSRVSDALAPLRDNRRRRLSQMPCRPEQMAARRRYQELLEEKRQREDRYRRKQESVLRKLLSRWGFR